MAPGGISIRAAWSAAAEVSAVAYGVQVEQIMAESRGRGPRPVSEVWPAKRMAVHLAIHLSGASYSALSREIGFHRDTVCSHCAGMREARIEDHQLDELANALEAAARVRLANAALTSREITLSKPMDDMAARLRAMADAFSTHSQLHPTKRPFIRQND